MATFGPYTQRTVFAVITASALGSGCYAWMARSGGLTGRSPMVGSSSNTKSVFGGAWRASSVSCAGSAQPVPSSALGKAGDEAKSLRPLVVCGPSGVGKGTLINMLLEDFPGRFGFSVSHTTRSPRPGEADGTHYHFVKDKDNIHKMIDDGKFIEHAHVHGNVYGTSIAAVQDVTAGDKICVLDIDVQGVKSVKGACRSVLDPHYLFIAAPSMDILEARLRGRGTETEAALKRRLANSKAEMDYGTSPGTFEKVLVNDGLKEAYAELKATAKTWYPQLAEDVKEQAETPREA